MNTKSAPKRKKESRSRQRGPKNSKNWPYKHRNPQNQKIGQISDFEWTRKILPSGGQTASESSKTDIPRSSGNLQSKIERLNQSSNSKCLLNPLSKNSKNLSQIFEKENLRTHPNTYERYSSHWITENQPQRRELNQIGDLGLKFF